MGSLINNKEVCEKEIQARVCVNWKKWREVKSVLNDKGMSMRLKTKIHYSGQAGDDVWFGVLGTKEGRKKVKYNRDENATNDVGCDLK